jgi:hypothetical protein
MVYHLAMTEDSTPYRLSDNREPLGDERPISLALTHSEWIELKIVLNNEIVKYKMITIRLHGSKGCNSCECGCSSDIE